MRQRKEHQLTGTIKKAKSQRYLLVIYITRNLSDFDIPVSTERARKCKCKSCTIRGHSAQIQINCGVCILKKQRNSILFVSHLLCCPEFSPQISGMTWPVLTVVVSISWHKPPPTSVVRAGPNVENLSKSKRTSQTARMFLNNTI